MYATSEYHTILLNLVMWYFINNKYEHRLRKFIAHPMTIDGFNKARNFVMTGGKYQDNLILVTYRASAFWAYQLKFIHLGHSFG